MVAIVTGNGPGLENSSAWVLGSRGQLGQTAMGRSGEGVFINAAQGQLGILAQDQMLIGTGLDGDISRIYTGASWRTVLRYVSGLIGAPNTQGSLVSRGGADGSNADYLWSASRNAYVTTTGAGAYDTLTFSGSTWTWTDGDSGVVETYDHANGGRLTSAMDPDGNVVTYSYNAAGKLSRVTTANGEYTDLIYTGTVVTQVTTTKADGQTSTNVRYGYNEFNRLTSVTVDLTPNDNSIADGKTYVTTYAYTASGRPWAVTEITQGDGSRLTIDYGSDGRVSSYTEFSASGVGRTTTLTYDTVNGVTTITDPANQVTKLYYDQYGQLTQILAPPATAGGAAQSYQFSYDLTVATNGSVNGNVTSVTLPGGEVTTYQYDANGNRILERDAAGVTVTRTFDAKNRLLTETRYLTPDPDGAGAGQPAAPATTRYVYDAESHLRFAISAEGRVTEYRYNTPGQMVSAIDYAANLYGVASLGVTDSPAEATVNAWVAAIADKSTTQRTDTTYDFRGNVSVVTRFGKVLSSGLGDTTATSEITRTTYVYDQNGQLLSRLPDGAASAEVFVYDGLGRVISSTDLAGSTTSIAFNDTSSTTVVTLANGLVKTSVHNLAGDLISYSESGPNVTTATWTHDYDGLGQLRRTTDPTGVNTYFFYDKVGRKIAEIDGDGTVTEYGYNADNLLVSTVRHAVNIQDMSAYAAAVGSATYTFALPAGIAGAGDQWSWNVYDAAQRVVETIDAAGAVTTHTYDGASRLVATKVYANALSAATVMGFKTTPPTAPQLPTADAAADRVSRFFYDRDGRQIGTLDAEGYLTETVYDGAGRKIETIAYASATTAGLRAAGALADLKASVTATVNAADIHNWFVYDARGLLRATIDGEGDLTRYHYTPRGDVDQVIVGQKLDPATLLATRPSLANLPAAPGGAVLETTSYARNLLGWVLSESKSLAGGMTEVTAYSYDKAGNVISAITSTQGSSEVRASTRVYDARGRLIRSLSGEGSAALGQLDDPTTAQTDAIYAAYGETYTYDAADRLITSTTSNGADTNALRTSYYYNADGRLIYQLNPLGEVVEYRYDALGRATDTIVHGTRIAGSVLGSLTGGLVNAAVTSAVAAITNANLDSASHIDYDARGLATQSIDAMGSTTTYAYNAFGELVSKLAPLDAATSTQTAQAYDRRGLLLSTTRDAAAGGLQLNTTFGYDAFGRQLRVTDAKGGVTTTGYDRAGRTVTATDAMGLGQTFTYDGRGNRLTSTDRTGKTTTYAYTAFNRQITVTTPEGVVSTSLINAYGQTVSLTDGEGRTTTYAYDKDGALTVVTDAAGAEVRHYDKAGRLADVVDAAGMKTSFTYDAANRVLTRKVDDGGLNLVTTYAYDAKGQQVSVTNPDGQVTTTAYDKAGRQMTVVLNPGDLAITTAYAYDKAGRVLTVTGPSGLVTQYTYDAGDRRTKTQVDPAGLNLTTTYTYDKNGNVVASTAPGGAITRYVYDAANRLTWTIDAIGAVTNTTYDGEGRVASVRRYANPVAAATLAGFALALTAANVTGAVLTSARDDVTTYVYDGDGRLRFTLDNTLRPTRYLYDGAGNLIRKARFAGSVAASSTYTVDYLEAQLFSTGMSLPAATKQIDRMVYDAANRLAFSIDATGAVTAYTYDLAGNLSQTRRYETAYTATGDPSLATMQTWSAGLSAAQVDDDRTSRVVHDAAGRAAYSIDAAGMVTSYGYDQAGRVVRTRRFETAYAGSGVPTLAAMQAWAAGLGGVQIDEDRTSRLVYDAAGRVAFSIDAAGLVVSYSYDAAGQVTKARRYETAYTNPADPSLATMQAWSAGLSGTLIDEDRIDRTVYDAAGRAAYQIDAEGYVSETRYDAAGRVSQTVRYADRYTVAEGATKASLAAQIGAQPASAAVTSYAYDAAGRVTDVTNAEGVVTHQVLDALGRIVDVYTAYGTSDQAITHRTYDVSGRLESETLGYGTADASTTSSYYDGLDRLTQTVNGRGFATDYAYDAVGRVRSKTVALAEGVSITTAYDYDAFGNQVKVTDPRGYVGVFYYDKLDRLALQIDPMGGATEYGYSLGGAVTRVKHYGAALAATPSPATRPVPTAGAGDAVTVITRDKLDRVTGTTDAMNFSETYQLNAFGDRVAVTNRLGGTTYNTFDKRGLLLTETLPVGSYRADGSLEAANVVNQYDYDARGNRIRSIEARGLSAQRTIVYDYDKLDRLILQTGDNLQILAPDMATPSDVRATQSFKYDKRGNLIQTVDAMGARTLYYYDALDRKTGQIDAVGALSTWQYDKAGNAVAAVVYGDAVALPANAGGTRPNPVNAGNYRLTTYDYDGNNRLTTTTVAGLRTGQIVGGVYVTQVGAVVSRIEYDAMGNVVRQVDGRGGEIYSYYDGNGRKVAEVDQENYLTLYTLDSNGNVLTEERLAVRLPGAVSTATSVASLRAATRDAKDRTTNFTYDLNGRRLTESRQNVDFGQVSFTLANGTATGGTLNEYVWYSTISYSYNGLGQVVAKTQATAASETTSYYYDLMGRQTDVLGPQLSDMDGTLTYHRVSTFYNGLNDVVRTREGRYQPDPATDRITQYVYDGGGRLYSVTDASGFARYFAYDAAGRVVREHYNRVTSNGSVATDAKIYGYDALGRLVMNGTANYGATLTFGDKTHLRYNVFGELTGRGVSAGNGPVTYQETYEYDSGGRMWRSNAGDGVTRLYVYDGAGAATLTVDPFRTYDLNAFANMEAAVATIGVAGLTGMAVSGLVTPTLTIYDRRGQTLETRENFRQYTTANPQFTADRRYQTAYNAFGEVVQQTDPLGNVFNFSYNTLGKLTKKESPTVAVTSEAGVTTYARPTEFYWYDLAGRMVASRDANGGTTMRWLLNGTGYDGVDALATIEMHADHGVVLSTYDIFRDLRMTTNELGVIESRTYDKMGRLQVIGRPMRSTADGGTQLYENYAYDGLGQRLAHWNSQLGTGALETTDYDLQGRVIRQVDMGGHATTYAYAYDLSLATSGLGTFGGWTKVTTTGVGKTSTDRTDLFGHLVSHVDLGGHAFTYDYDRSGSLIRETQAASLGGATLGTKTYAYFNSGQLGAITEQVDVGDDHMTGTTTYAYDALGNRTAEYYAERRWGLRVSYSWRPTWMWDDYYYDPVAVTEAYDNTIVYRSTNATYDALGRMTGYSDGGEGGNQPVAVTWKYDAVGNIRNVHADYGLIGGLGLAPQDQWFRYDSMNRTVTSKGILKDGAIVRGYQGVDLAYDAAGQRVSAITTERKSLTRRYKVFPEEDPSAWYWQTDYYPYDADRIETYSYTNDGYLSQVRAAITSASLNGTTLNVTPAGTPALIQQDRRDAMGRLVDHVEYANGDSLVTYSEQTDYDAASNVIHTRSSRFVQLGVTQNAETYVYYGANGSAGGAYQGVATYNLTYNTTVTNGVSSAATVSDTTTSYVWWDGARQQEVRVRADIYGAPNTVNRSYFTYDTTGKLSSVSISDGRPRTVSYTTDAMGQVLSRKEADNNTAQSDPLSYSYWMEGRKIGEFSNDGSDDLTWLQTYVGRALPQTGPFGSNIGPTPFGDFDQGYAPINQVTNNGGSADSRVTARSGDTLSSIAQSLWGDASLWWLLAQANGLSMDDGLAAGQSLVVPAKVINAHHNADTFRPYDPNKAIGDVSPTEPAPIAPQAPKGKKGCGTVGTILTIAIAVAVAYFTAGAALTAMAGQGATFASVGLSASTVAAGAIGGAVGSIASQAFALATGAQDKFSWKGVAMSAIAGGVGGGLAGANAFQSLAKAGEFAVGAARGAVGSVITQGVAVATGLQDRFDWTGVAVGAAVGGVSASLSAQINARWTAAARPWSTAGMAGSLVSGAAAAVAGAATRSLIDGSDFGDNIVRALPDVIGSTIGNAIGQRVAAQPTALEAYHPEDPGELTHAPYVDPASLTSGNTRNSLFIQADYIRPKVDYFASSGDAYLTPAEQAADGSTWVDEVVVTAQRKVVESRNWLQRNVIDPVVGFFRHSNAEAPSSSISTHGLGPAPTWYAGARYDTSTWTAPRPTLKMGGVEYYTVDNGRADVLVQTDRSRAMGDAYNRAVRQAGTPVGAIAAGASRALGGSLQQQDAWTDFGYNVEELGMAGAAVSGRSHAFIGNQSNMDVVNGPKSAGVDAPSSARGASLRLQYMGATPDKFSRTGADVVSRMQGEGLIQGSGPLVRGNPNGLQLVGKDGSLVTIDSRVDMAHTTDAVTWWNQTGRFFGAKSPEVRQFMLNSDNYVLQSSSINRSAGASLKQTYQPPAPPDFTTLKR